MEEQRKKFEEWYRREYSSYGGALRRADAMDVSIHDDKKYSLMDVQMAWSSWQAAVTANVELTSPPTTAGTTEK